MWFPSPTIPTSCLDLLHEFPAGEVMASPAGKPHPAASGLEWLLHHGLGPGHGHGGRGGSTFPWLEDVLANM